MRPATRMEIAQAADVLGVEPPPEPATYDQRVQALEIWKSDVLDMRWKALVRVRHPDRGGDVAHMAKINAARDLLLTLQAVRPPPVRPRGYPGFTVIINGGVVYDGAASSGCDTDPFSIFGDALRDHASRRRR